MLALLSSWTAHRGSFISAFYRFSYPHTWVGTILSISVVTYIACQATTDPASAAQ